MAIDGFTQLLTSYESTNTMRILTGFLLGSSEVGFSLQCFPLDLMNSKVRRKSVFRQMPLYEWLDGQLPCHQLTKPVVSAGGSESDFPLPKIANLSIVS